MSLTGNKPYIIAEAGVNHQGSYKLALAMVHIAKWAGADCIKFQAYKTNALIRKRRGSKKWLTDAKILKPLELSYGAFVDIKSTCAWSNIDFLASVFNMRSMNEILSLGCTRLKWASPCIKDLKMLKAVPKGIELFISTGYCTYEDIDRAIEVIRGKNPYLLMHCVSEYPAENAALDRIDYLRERYKCEVGYSDHTLGIDACIAATNMGACVIEKHFTISRDLRGPDHKISCDIVELKELVEGVKKC